MTTDLTEEEMRRALFGGAEASAPAHMPSPKDDIPDVVIVPPVQEAPRKKVTKSLTPKLKVTLRVGNEFEGETEILVYQADTLSTLLAEQDATRAARKKFKYIEVISVLPV